MGQFDALNQTINSMNPRAIRERKQEDQRMSQAQDWKMEQRGLEKRLLHNEIREMERKTSLREKKDKAMSSYESLKSLVSDAETLRSGSPEDAKGKAQEYLERYEDPRMKQMFMETVQSGDFEPLYNALEQAEGTLSREFDMEFDQPEKSMYMTKDGKISYLPKNSRIADRPAEEWEVEANSMGIPVGSPQWENFNKKQSEIKVPEVVLSSMPEGVRPLARDAYIAAGGGKAGMDAIKYMEQRFNTQEQVKGAPDMLARSFPQATPSQMSKLKITMEAWGDDVKGGLAAAGKVREQQRTDKKGRAFSDRAITLLQGIKDSDQVGDVTGNLEGNIDTRIGVGFGLFGAQEESDLIADIREVSDILTKDNMDLMTGVLSETDIKMLKNISAGALDRTRGEAKFMKGLNTLLDKLLEAQAEYLLQ